MYKDFFSPIKRVRLIPNLSSAVMTLHPLNLKEIKIAEFIYWYRITKQEYIVCITKKEKLAWIRFDFYKLNGNLVFTKKATFKGKKFGVNKDIDIKVSPNGEYIFIKLQLSKYQK